MARFLGWAWAPVIASIAWITTILGLLIWWLADGHPQYRDDEATVVFISSVGAKHQAIFIVGGVITAIFYPLTLFAERWLRHIDKLPTTNRTREKTAAWIGIVFACVASIALILLTSFNSFTHGTVHWTCTAVFIVAIAVSAFAQAAEVLSLRRANPSIVHLKRSARAKIVIIVIVLVATGLFIGCYAACSGNSYGRGDYEDRDQYPHCNAVVTTAAVSEWFIAFMFSIYLLTFVVDLLPYISTSVTKFGATTSDLPRGDIEAGSGAQPMKSEMGKYPVPPS